MTEQMNIYLINFTQHEAGLSAVVELFAVNRFNCEATK